MAKRSERVHNTRTKRDFHSATEADPVVTYHSKHKPHAVRRLEPKTEMQSRYMQAIESKSLVFAIGPAGTGKTYIPTAMAADALAANRITQIIITRPAVEAGEQLGFLPGELDEKYAPYLQPLQSTFIERLGRGAYECALKNEKIVPVPLAFMRGRTFDDCIVILDEAQNVTAKQMKMFLSRIGENCLVVVCGDTDQVDIPGTSGLMDAVKRCSWIEEAEVVEFDLEDVVRSGLCLKVLQSYSST